MSLATVDWSRPKLKNKLFSPLFNPILTIFQPYLSPPAILKPSGGKHGRAPDLALLWFGLGRRCRRWASAPFAARLVFFYMWPKVFWPKIYLNPNRFYNHNHIRDNHVEYWKFKTSGGLFQINAMNVRSRQFVEDVLTNTRVQSMCRKDNDPPKEGEFVINM